MGNKPATTTQTQTQNSTRNPWDPAIAPLTGLIGRADALSQDTQRFTPQYSTQTNAGIQGLTDLANSGPGGGFQALDNVVGGSGQGFGTGLGTLQNVASGGMLNGNQYLDPVLDRVAADTAGRVNSQFTAGGRYGSGAHAGTLAREVGDTVARARLSNYQQERTAQDNAARTLYGGGFQGAGMAGAMDQAELRPAMLNLQAGQMRDQQMTAERTAPMNAVQWGAGIINPMAQLGGTSNSSGTTTSQTTQPTNWATTALGAGMMGLGAFTGNPALMAGGANGLMSGLGGGGGGGGFTGSMFGGSKALGIDPYGSLGGAFGGGL